MYTFPMLPLNTQVAASNVYGFPAFSGNLFSVLIYCFEVGDDGMGWLLDSLLT